MILRQDGGDPQPAPSKTSFLSRLAESNKKVEQTETKSDTESSKDLPQLQKPKSVRWGNTASESLPATKQNVAHLDAVVEEKEEKENAAESEEPKELPPHSSRQRTRSKSRSRKHRSKSRKRTESDEVKKPESKRKMKWDELLNASKTSFHFSTDSFCFDFDNEKKSPSPLKTIVPNLNPVVFRNGVPATPSKPPASGSPLDASNAQENDVMMNQGVDQIIKDTKRRAEDSRKRQARLSGQAPTTPRGATTDATNPCPSQTSVRLDASERLQNANSLILEKKKRREASKARQVELDVMKSPPSALEMSNNFELCHPKSPLDIVQEGIQFTPALRVSNMAISSKLGLDSIKIPLTGRDNDFKLDSRPSDDFEKNSRPSDLKQSGKENAGKSRRSILPVPTTSEEKSDSAKENKGDRAERTRVSRKERAEARRASRGHKMGASSSKWKELSLKVDEIQNQSFRSSLENADVQSPKSEEPAVQRKPGSFRSKWAGLKGSMDFISRMKMKPSA